MLDRFLVNLKNKNLATCKTSAYQTNGFEAIQNQAIYKTLAYKKKMISK